MQTDNTYYQLNTPTRLRLAVADLANNFNKISIENPENNLVLYNNHADTTINS